MNIQFPNPPSPSHTETTPPSQLKEKNPWTCSGLEIKSVPFVSPSFLLPLICTSVRMCVRVDRRTYPPRSSCERTCAGALNLRAGPCAAGTLGTRRSIPSGLTTKKMLACKNKQTNKFAEWHYYYNDCYMILPYEKHDNFADQSMKTYKKWEKTTMLHTLHTTHYTIHTHTQYTLLYEYIQLWLWRNDQLLKTIRKIIKTCLFVVPRRYQIPLR